MNARRSIVSILVMAGCAAPVPPPASPPPPLVASTPPPVASTPPPAGHPTMVWTTASNTDDCRAFPVESAPQFSTFDSREACESWVARRHCRPGSTCSDGCNTRWCSEDGDHVATTLLSCELHLQMKFEFQRGSSAAPASAKKTIKENKSALQLVLDEPSGTITLRGQSSANDAKGAIARTKLAEARTRTLRDVLAAEGVPRDRIQLTTDPDDAAGVSIVTLVGHADAAHHECKAPTPP